jgi:osmotically-inducible protein OsmY
MLLHAATSRTCAQAQAEDASQEPPPQPQASPHKNTQDKASTNSQILSNIQSSLNGDPILSGTDVQVSVDDVNITLTGSVQSQGQLDRVLALASPYVSYRRMVNHVAVH